MRSETRDRRPVRTRFEELPETGKTVIRKGTFMLREAGGWFEGVDASKEARG